MDNLKIYIDSKDIDKYLLNHKEDKKIKYKEALFIKYLKDISYNEYGKKSLSLFLDPCPEDFDTYISRIKKKHSPDIEDISLILVPALGLNGLYTGDINVGINYINNYARLLDDSANMEKVIKETMYRLRNISKEYANNHNNIDYPIKQIGVFNDILGRYAKLRNLGIIDYNGSDFSLIGKDRCEKELENYTDVYGYNTVEIIKEYTKELKKDFL